MTTLTYLGHACFLFETEKAGLLIDPWLSPTGAFLSAWRQLPPNDHALAKLIENMKQKPVLIYVTHEHEDHYDEETLRQLLPHAAGLATARYESDFLKNLIKKNLGIVPQQIGENEPQHFHDITFKIFIDESGINRDSAVFVKSNDLSFFDGNDCKIFDRTAWLLDRCGPIDILSCQFSGANMHPATYDLPEGEYHRISHQKRLRKFVAVRNFIREMKPRYYIPSAGPAIFPAPELESLNFDPENIFPKWWEFQTYLANRVPAQFVALDVLGTAAAQTGEMTFSGIAQKLSDEELHNIIAYYRAVDAKAPPPAPLDAREVLSYFEREMERKIAVLKKYPTVKLACPLYFDIATGESESAIYSVHPERRALERVKKDGIVPPYYLHRTSIASLGKLMRSGKGWGTYFLSFFFRNTREPDAFDSPLGIFLVANDDADMDFGFRKLLEFRENEETISLAAPDGKSSVTCRRFCPHQGADLKYATFDGRYVTCPRHQWRFDCANGGKADNSDDSINAVLNRQVAV